MESNYIRVRKIDGEKTRALLIELEAIDKNLKIISDGDYLKIPVTRFVEGFNDTGRSEFEVVQKELSPGEHLGYSPAYEFIGDIAIIDRHEEDPGKIADVLIRQKRVKTVLKAQTSVTGEYRTRDLLFLAGEENTETIYRENGCRYLLDVAKVYFTPRLATERARIADQVNNGDKVVDMFAGIGPFSILIAKRYPASHVMAIDKNPLAIKYLIENVKLNKVRNIEVREGDASKAVKDTSGADHVIMNLPQNGFEFLETAFGIVKNGGIIHFYSMSHIDDLFEGTLKRIENIAHKMNMNMTPINKRIVRPYAPYQYNICIDIRCKKSNINK